LAFAASVMLLAVGAASPALAETIGGEQLASHHRTVTLGVGADPLPKVWAETWILADAGTGAVLAQKGSHVQRAPASTLKMLTALAVMPNTEPTDTTVATKKAAYTYGSRVGLKPGKTYTLDQLWYAVFLPSANDAAIAVAQANGGVGKTIDEMNAIAYRLQARDTVAKTPNGLDTPGQVSSAYDLALIARVGMAMPEFSHYTGTSRAMFPDVRGKGEHPIYTTNRLLRHGYEGMTGVKTGFTTRAGRTYVGSATRGGRTLIVSLMGIHEASETAARKLLDWGFANADKVASVGQLVTALDPNDPNATPSPTAAGGTGPTPIPIPSTDKSRSATTLVATADPAGVSMAVLWGAGLVAAGAACASLIAAVRRRRT
jgi:D-alanyl-D-alanine carboxypeptidase (penicillin-binding protein 5/6)